MSGRVTSCPDPVELGRHFSAGAGDLLAEHFEACARCAKEWEALRQLRSLARDLPFAAPDPVRVEEIRTALLSRAARAPVTRTRALPWRHVVAFVAAAASVAIAVRLWVGERSAGPAAHAALADGGAHFRAALHVEPGAKFERVSATPDETVRLTEGEVEAVVQPLGARERFRVVVGDAEVEVRGTEFAVVARLDRLMAVRVRRGRVEVRRSGQPPFLLSAGEKWELAPRAPPEGATEIAPEAPRATKHRLAHPRVTVGAAPAVTPVGAAPPIGIPPSEIAFQEGWRALQTGDAAPAADAFARCLRIAPEGSLAEDASFWRGVALSRTARRSEATAALRSFAARFVTSPRRGEALVMAGSLLLAAGRSDEARACFNAVTADSPVSVRAAASEGLQELARRAH